MPSILVREVNKAAEQRHKKEELQKVTDEILAYRAQESKAIFEIGKRLKHVKENDLVHGEWLNWLETIDIKPRTAQRYIKVYERLGNTPTLSHLSPSKLFELLSLPKDVKPEEFVKKEHFIKSNNRTKTVEEMTVREVKEVVKKHKNQVKGRKAARNKQDRHRASNVVEFPNNQGQVGQQKEQQPPQQQAHEKEQPEIIKPFLNLTGEVIKLFERGVIDANIAWEVGKLSKQKQATFIKIIEGMKHNVNEDKRILALILNSEYTEKDVVNIYNAKVNADKLHKRAIYLSYLTEGDVRERLCQFTKLMEEINIGLFVVSARINSSEKRDLIGLSKKISEILPQIKSLIEKLETEAKNGNASKIFNVSKSRSYDILGVNNEASQEEIRNRFRKLVKILHPDKGGDAKLFQLVREAYEQLKA